MAESSQQKGQKSLERITSPEQLSDYFKVSDRTISNWFSELEKLNLIIRYQLKFNSVSHTYLNSYKLGKKRNKKI